MLAAGRKVAVCEQVEDAAQAKGLVKRDVVEVLTPGTAINSQLLDSRENNYCLSIHMEGARAGVALIDVSTGELVSGECDVDSIQNLVQGKRVREVIFAPGSDRDRLAAVAAVLGDPFLSEIDGGMFESASVERSIGAQFSTGDETGSVSPLERVALGALLSHCQSLTGGALPQVVTGGSLTELAFLNMDDETLRNLELFEPLHGGSKKATLIHLIDDTVTPMGGREIRLWLAKTVVSRGSYRRACGVKSGAFYGDATLHETVVSTLKGIHDMQRVATRIAARKAIPREFHALRESLEKLPSLTQALGAAEAGLIASLRNKIGDHRDIADTIARAIGR